MEKPIIGIPLDHSTKKASQGGYASFPWYALRTHYSEAVVKAGGIPIFLPYEQEVIQDYLKICKGLIFPGGDTDIPPSFYGEKVSVKKINLDESNPRKGFEFKLLRAALETKIPILGICAGFQVLNVALGGSLYQDIQEQVTTNIIHSKHSENYLEDVHPIEVMKETLLHKITGKTNYTVNSFHHQTVKKLGRDLIQSAVAPDGLIEAIELSSHPFCIGVEWHPEFQHTDEDIKLFRALIVSAHKHK